MTHEELQQQIVELAHLLGWEHLHARRSIGKGHRWVTALNVVGWPDLLLWSVRQPGRHIAIELKVPPDKLRPDQERVLDRLNRAGFETYVVWPGDVEKVAALLRKPPSTVQPGVTHYPATVPRKERPNG